MKKVIIVGGGLAGISAGIKLLEERPDTSVTLYNLGHHMGGKAASYRDEYGFNIDHGFHALSSTYDRMLGMLKRAGVDFERSLVRDKGTYFYDDARKDIFMAGTPESVSEDAKRTNEFFMLHLPTILFGKDIEQLDDICWTAWCIENGLDEELTKKLSFRFSKDALFNWPHEISAYIQFMSIRMIAGSQFYYLSKGTYNEQVINPLVKYFEKLGGKIEMYQKLTEVRHENGRVTALRFSQPDFYYHHHGKVKWERIVRILPETTEVTDLDHAIISIPVDSLRELNKGDASFWKGFPGIENLRSVATLSLQTWTKEPVFKSMPNCINLLDEPMPMVIDYKYVRDEYKHNKNFGSVLEWVGQENTFEEYTDEQLINRTYDALLKVPQAKDPRKAGIIHEHLSRNTSNHERYLLTEPGTVKFRPHSKTHFKNMFLAGDWIRNDIDVPTMEGAICSGFTAVEELLKVL